MTDGKKKEGPKALSPSKAYPIPPLSLVVIMVAEGMAVVVPSAG